MRWIKYNLIILLILMIVVGVCMIRHIEFLDLERLLIVFMLQLILQIEGLIESKQNV